MRSKQNNRNFLWTLHHWAGLYFGILIGMLCFTGAMAVFIPEIDGLIVKHHYGAMTSGKAGTLNLNHSIDSLQKAFPGLSSLMIVLPERKDAPVHVDLITKKDSGPGIERYDFFLDGARGHFLGKRDHQNAIANYLRQMHVRLYEGNWGRQLVGLGGVALTVLVVTGFLIYGDFMKKQEWPKRRKSLKLRIKMADWHKLLGISALAFNLVIAITGAWLGLQPYLMRWLDIRIPNNYYEQSIEMTADADKAQAVDWNQALVSTAKLFPELSVTDMSLSTDGSSTILIRGDVPGLIYERSISSIVLDKQTYKMKSLYDIRKQPLASKLFYIQEPLHFGDFGGIGLKLLYAALGLASAFLSLSGFLIYLYRTEKKSQRMSSGNLKITFIWSLGLLLFLAVIALVSTQMGYNLAAQLAAILVNGSIIAWLVYALFMRIRKKELITSREKL